MVAADSLPHVFGQQVHLPTNGILRMRMAAIAESAKVVPAVARIAIGVERRGINAADIGARMNMWRRYMP